MLVHSYCLKAIKTHTHVHTLHSCTLYRCLNSFILTRIKLIENDVQNICSLSFVSDLSGKSTYLAPFPHFLLSVSFFTI